MPFDLFSTHTMLMPLIENFDPKTFIRSTFFSSYKTFDTEHVVIDLYRGARRMAPFVRPRKGGKTIEREGREIRQYTPPLVAPQAPTTAEDIQKRGISETPFATKTSDERAAEQLGRDLAELDEMVTRREEWMCAQALFEGQIHMFDQEEGIDEVIEYPITHIALSGTSLWSDAGSNPLADLKNWCRQVGKDSGVVPNMAILASDAIDAFLKNESVLKALDTRRVDLGQINPQALPNGASYIGHILLPEVSLDLYGYNEWVYDEETSKDVPIVPSGRIILGNPSARTEMLYGTVYNLKQGSIAEPRVPFSWVENDGSARWVRVSARPLPVPIQAAAFLRATVL